MLFAFTPKLPMALLESREPLVPFMLRTGLALRFIGLLLSENVKILGRVRLHAWPCVLSEVANDRMSKFLVIYPLDSLEAHDALAVLVSLVIPVHCVPLSYRSCLSAYTWEGQYFWPFAILPRSSSSCFNVSAFTESVDVLRSMIVFLGLGNPIALAARSFIPM